MTIYLYSLPNCGICNMVKKKLEAKNIKFIEENFEEIAGVIKSDHAPALIIDSGAEGHLVLNSPLEINNWIKNYGE